MTNQNSTCCGAYIKPASKMESMLGVPDFYCSKCGNEQPATTSKSEELKSDGAGGYWTKDNGEVKVYFPPTRLENWEERFEKDFPEARAPYPPSSDGLITVVIGTSYEIKSFISTLLQEERGKERVAVLNTIRKELETLYVFREWGGTGGLYSDGVRGPNYETGHMIKREDVEVILNRFIVRS